MQPYGMIIAEKNRLLILSELEFGFMKILTFSVLTKSILFVKVLPVSKNIPKFEEPQKSPKLGWNRNCFISL